MARLNRGGVDPQDVKRALQEPVERPYEAKFEKGVVSTGSTLLDLTISGKRIRGGGIPGGVLAEIFSAPGLGKSLLIAEILASAVVRGGDIAVKDPEARLDQEYLEMCHIQFPRNKYEKPDLVPEVFKSIRAWDPKPKRKGAICVQGVDSLSALTTKTEESEEGDKRGQTRAKQISEQLRLTCRKIEREGWIVVASNHEKSDEHGWVTPGGKGVPFYASLRIRLQKKYEGISPKWRLEEAIKYGDKKISQLKGIISNCTVVKSSIDTPFRECPIYIVFGYGVHDVMANLQYYKDYSGLGRYLAVDKGFIALEDAVRYIENNNLEEKLREMTIDLWEDIQKKFEIERKPKVRF